MKKILLALVLFVCTFTYTYHLSLTTVKASGEESTSGDQIIIHTEDGVMYLDKEVIEDNQGESVRYKIMNSEVAIPKGFFQDLGEMINKALTLVIAIAALLVFLYLIWGGIDWITSGGDKSKTETARQKIVSAVIGLIVVAASFAILTIVLNFLGIGSLQEALDQAVENDIGVVKSDSSQDSLGDLVEE